MKRIQLILALTGVMVLASCSNYSNFSKRKYTKGNFRPKSGSLRAEKPERNSQEEAILSLREVNIEAKKSRLHSSSKSIDNDLENFEDVLKSEKTDLDLSEEGSRVSTQLKSSALEKKDHKGSIAMNLSNRGAAEITKSKKKDKPNNKRKTLTDEQKNARATLVLGIIAIGIATIVFTLTPVLAFSGSFFSIFALIRISALFGILGVFKGTAFYKNPLEGKYKKFRRKGLFLSILAVALWLVLFLI